MLSKVMLIRHGEKPEKDDGPGGITADGNPDKESLTPRGWQRAGALAGLFAPSNQIFPSPLLAKPAVIYAADPAGASRRPLETIKPLAQKLGIDPVKSFAKGQEPELAASVNRDAGVVLISWQHERIPAIVKHLTTAAPPLSAIPAVWPGDRFDMVWVLIPPAAAAHAAWVFHQVPQLLLGGDLSTAFA